MAFNSEGAKICPNGCHAEHETKGFTSGAQAVLGAGGPHTCGPEYTKPQFCWYPSAELRCWLQEYEGLDLGRPKPTLDGPRWG
jgi:hypothetical protein